MEHLSFLRAYVSAWLSYSDRLYDNVTVYI